MLIKDGQLDIAEFKTFFISISWTKLPRKLGIDHKDYFYSGLYENDVKRINITIRPSKVMALSETFKNRMPIDGSEPLDGYRGQLVEWGASVELKVDDNFIKEVDALASSLTPKITQTLNW